MAPALGLKRHSPADAVKVHTNLREGQQSSRLAPTATFPMEQAGLGIYSRLYFEQDTLFAPQWPPALRDPSRVIR